MAPPSINQVVPNEGPISGGQPIEVQGSAFTGATDVTLAGEACTSLVVVSDARITCVTPSGSLGMVTVEVVTTGGAGSLTNAYEYIPDDRFTPIRFSTRYSKPMFVKGRSETRSGMQTRLGTGWWMPVGGKPRSKYGRRYGRYE